MDVIFFLSSLSFYDFLLYLKYAYGYAYMWYDIYVEHIIIIIIIDDCDSNIVTYCFDFLKVFYI